MTTAREPFDRSRAGFYAPHRLYEDADLADILLDHDQVAAYFEMLHQSDRQAGAPVLIPRAVQQGWLDRWVKAGLIELASGDHYIVPGTAEAATRRIEKARSAARARWGADAPSNAQSNAPSNARGVAHGLRSTVSGVVGVEPLHRKKRTTRSSPTLPDVPPALDRSDDGERESVSEVKVKSEGRAVAAPRVRSEGLHLSPTEALSLAQEHQAAGLLR
jgi:hypothetical protein